MLHVIPLFPGGNILNPEISGTYPYGLIGWAEIFSWICDPEGGPLWEEITLDELDSGPYGVVGHAAGRFVLLPVEYETAAEEAADWAGRGFPVRIIRPWSLH